MLDVTPTEDGTMLKVCLEQNGIVSCCYTSSMHLVEDHRKQLERANNRKAAAAYQEEFTALEWDAMFTPLHDA